MKEKRHRIARLLGAMTDLPESAFADLPELTLFGGQEVQVLRHHGVTEYTDSCVAVRTGDFRLEICGEELLLCAMDGDALTVRGRITGVLLRREAEE